MDFPQVNTFLETLLKERVKFLAEVKENLSEVTSLNLDIDKK